jgi:transposase
VKILAIDLGDTKSVACDYEAMTGKHQFETVPTTAQAIHDLVAKRGPDRVVIEVGPPAGWVHDLIAAMEIEIQVANPNHEAWRWKKVKNKSDRKDSVKMAQLSAVNQLPTVHMPTKDVREWRELIQYRRTVVDRRTAIKNSIRSILKRTGRKLPPGKNAWSARSIARLHEMATSASKELWRDMLAEELLQYERVEESIKRVEQKLDELAKADGRVRMLRTAACVGPRLAEAVVAVIDDPHRFTRGKQVAAYIGLTPRQMQSGAMERQGRISRQGHRLLRSLLIQIAWLGVSRVPWMKKAFEGVHRGSKTRKKIAIVAVARRLLIRLWAMLRDGTVWREPAEVTALRLAA